MTNRKKQIEKFVKDEAESRTMKNIIEEKMSKLNIHKLRKFVQGMKDMNIGKNKRTKH